MHEKWVASISKFFILISLIKACKIVFHTTSHNTGTHLVCPSTQFLLVILLRFWLFSSHFQVKMDVFRFPTQICVFIMIIRHFLSQYQAEDIINIGGFRISKNTVCLCQGLTSKCWYQNFYQSVSLAQNHSKSIYRLKFGFMYGASLISIHSRKYVL